MNWPDVVFLLTFGALIWRRLGHPPAHEDGEMIVNEQNQSTQATGSSVAENLSSLIQQAAGTHTSPTFAHILSISSEVLGVVTEELETALKDKLDVQALNNGLQDVLVGSQQAERGMVTVYGVLKSSKKSTATPTAETAHTDATA